jgi:glycosyltransferase involved in cell wall biosynthesis
MSEILLSIVTVPYNHDIHISQAIKGILLQKSSFDFEFIIGEDHSNDNTRQMKRVYKTNL